MSRRGYCLTAIGLILFGYAFYMPLLADVQIPEGGRDKIKGTVTKGAATKGTVTKSTGGSHSAGGPGRKGTVKSGGAGSTEKKRPDEITKKPPSVPLEPQLFVQPDGVKVNPIDGAEMVHIPSGAFLMGDKDQVDTQLRKANLDGFWIYKTPVTVAQYKKFCAATNREMPPMPSFNQDWSLENHPIVNVTWDDAVAYSKWAFGDNIHHLPTEAQWEKAARSTDGRKFPWGDEWNKNQDKCNNGEKGPQQTTPVDKYPPNRYGLYDMAGNVWQWCADWYDEASKKDRVLRGGSWETDTDKEFYRCSYRYRSDKPYSEYIGFRCASQK